MRGDDTFETRLVERPARRVFSFGDAVAEEHQEISGLDDDAPRVVGGVFEHAEGDAAAGRARDALEPAVAPAQERRQVSRVDVLETAVTGIVEAVEQRDEAGWRTMPRDLDVETGDEPRRLEALVDERAEHREEQRHQERRGTAFAGDVAERDHEPAVGQREDVIEIAADGVGRTRHAAHNRVTRGPDAARQHGELDVARDFEVAFERETVGDLHEDQEVDRGKARQQPQRSIGPLGQRQGDPEREQQQLDGRDAAEQQQNADERHRDRQRVKHAARRREPHREGREDEPGPDQPAPIPGLERQFLEVDRAREVAVCVGRLPREQPLEVGRRQVTGVLLEERPGPRAHTTRYEGKGPVSSKSAAKSF